jgi:hypothetical protein
LREGHRLKVANNRVPRYFDLRERAPQRTGENCIAKSFLSEISGPHGGKYKDGCLLGCCAV